MSVVAGLLLWGLGLFVFAFGLGYVVSPINRGRKGRRLDRVYGSVLAVCGVALVLCGAGLWGLR